MISEKNLHRLILPLPGLVCATILRLSGLIGTTAMASLYVLDIIGSLAGSVWLVWSQKLATKLHKRLTAYKIKK